MMSAQSSIAQAIQIRQNKFVETRTIIDVEVTKFVNSLNELGSEVPESCRHLIGKTTQEILPTLWATPFNKENYLVELQSFQACVAAVKAVGDAINEEAYRCLQG